LVLRPGLALRLIWASGLLALALGWAPARAQAAAPCSAVTRVSLTLEDAGGGPGEAVAPLAVLTCLDPDADPLPVLSPTGRPASLPRRQALVLREEPDSARQRLARLERAGLGTETRLRVLEGRIQENDSQWLVEMAWGEPQRRFMVNLFYDEEHFVYLRPGQEPLLLRFKGGRLGGRLEGRLGAPPGALPTDSSASPASPAESPSPAPVERATTPR
jgi:hypothetical protein